MWALAHPRGGGELGRQWYLDGKLLAKPNTFGDMIASGEHLIAEGVVDGDRLAIRGGSAGGLLVAACMTQDNRFLYIGMEFVVGGELFTYLRRVVRFPKPQAALYTAQVTSMFEYLHSNNVIYRDLKPENLLIDGDGYLKLTDFGFAKVVENRTYTLCGTPEYIAPEIILNKGHGKGVDWWTVGVLVYEMLAGIDPFNDQDPMMIYQNIIRGNLKFPRTFDKDGRSLVKHLLVSDLSKRYGNLKNGLLISFPRHQKPPFP